MVDTLGWLEIILVIIVGIAILWALYSAVRLLIKLFRFLKRLVLGIISFFWNAIQYLGYFFILHVLLGATIFYLLTSQMGIISGASICGVCGIYLAIVWYWSRRKALKDVKNQLLSIIETDGIISIRTAEKLRPSRSMIQWLTMLRYSPNDVVHMLDEKLEHEALLVDEFGAERCYFEDNEWGAAKEDIVNTVVEAQLRPFYSQVIVKNCGISLISLDKALSKYVDKDKKLDEINEKISVNASERRDDLLQIFLAMAEERFLHYLRKLVDSGQIIVGKNETMYINRSIFEERRKKIPDLGLIEEKNIKKWFGIDQRDEEQEILDVLSEQCSNGMRYRFVESREGNFWLSEELVEEHSCEECNRLAQIIKKYRGKKYCESCLLKIRKQEEREQKENKTEVVRRIVSAPPPGVKIVAPPSKNH